jgi:hypothetical protein
MSQSTVEKIWTQAIGSILGISLGYWWLFGPPLFPGLDYRMPSILIEGKKADWMKFSDWAVQPNGWYVEATVTFTPPSSQALVRECKVDYMAFDSNSVKLDEKQLSVPQINAGEKARVKFYMEKGTKVLKLQIGNR